MDIVNLTINDWNLFPWVVEGKELIITKDNVTFVDSFIHNNLYKKNYFARGKFFIFLLLNKKTGLKFFHSHKNKVNSNIIKSLKTIIRIQKIFYQERLSFDCEDEIIEIIIEDSVFHEKHTYYGYKTCLDIDIKKMEEMGLYKVLDWQRTNGHINIFPDGEKMCNKILEVMKANNINRRSQLGKELIKSSNYILTNNNELKFIDIDPRMYIQA